MDGTTAEAAVSSEKPKGPRLIALNRSSFDLIEIVGARVFGPDIYYHYRQLHPPIERSGAVSRARAVASPVGGTASEAGYVHGRARLYPRASQTRRSSSHEPLRSTYIHTSHVTRSGIRKHSY